MTDYKKITRGQDPHDIETCEPNTCEHRQGGKSHCSDNTCPNGVMRCSKNAPPTLTMLTIEEAAHLLDERIGKNRR